MKRIAHPILIAVMCTSCAIGGEREGSEEGRRIGTGLVVELGLAGATVSEKVGLAVVSNSGARLFGAALIRQGDRGLGTATYIASRLPKTVRVTWRTDTEMGKYWSTGRVIGDYVIEVDRRVPDDVIRYANAGSGRALRLLFRIKDDGVLFGWDVEETVRHPKGGSGLVFSMHGGDFPCDTSPYQSTPDCTEGPLERAQWYNPQWIRK